MSMDDLGYLETDYERAVYLQNLLVDRATGEVADNADDRHLRMYFHSEACAVDRRVIRQ